jgi:hypothetical protein
MGKDYKIEAICRSRKTGDIYKSARKRHLTKHQTWNAFVVTFTEPWLMSQERMAASILKVVQSQSRPFLVRMREWVYAD